MKRRYNSVEKFTELALSQASDTDSQPFNPSRRPKGRNQPPRVPLYNSPNTANRQIQSSRSRPYPPNTNSHLAQRAAESVASTNRTQKSYDKLADVYSASSDSFQFADNLRAFFDNNVPGFVWTVFSVLQIVAGLVSIFVGTFNYPLCHIEPKIPLYLILSGLIIIINGSVRICIQIPTPTPTTRNKGFGVRNLCRYALEGSILFAILVIVILGCVWVYGAKYVQFERYRFERNYCDYFLYWFSWWSVTLHLLVFSIVITCLITILIYGAMVSK